MSEANRSQQSFENPMFREIHKNTWLKKVSPNNTKKRRERLWVVFCVHDDTDAFLETYNDNKVAVFHKPEWHVSLNNVQHISPTICAHEQEYEFVLTLSNEVIRLAAPTWEEMLDWVESLKSKLFELRILSPKENVYTKLPEKTNLQLLSTRDPTSPLPPPPEVPPENLPGIEPSNNDPIINSNHIITYERRRSESQSSGTSQRTNNINESASAGVNISSQVFNFDHFNAAIETTSNSMNSVHYEHLFQMQPGPSTRNNHIMRLETDTTSRMLERSASCSPRILQPPPQPYKTLREQQVILLEKEMKHPTGVRLQLRRKDCINSIGFVDAFDAVWVCGWKQKENPMLYNALHIGDRLLNIEGINIKSASDAYRILQSHYCGLYASQYNS
ncbi:uncharacterized protein LOC132695535 isoform X2 [Cylas formicarius]|uniref:uncharacterized protein LOC132695535 isoform X2 n=1 Tax=Cylas formicarius TaxID=197179 RepID=UPI002958C8B0|nr:uncharacterized protein LOC132695535 isoform X2 [Cylas formicarius]